MLVDSKKDSYSLLHSGRLGNRLRMWDSFDEILKSGYSGTVSIRYKSTGGGFVAYNVPLEDIPKVQQEWKDKGAKEELMTYNESAPDHLMLIQGELMRNDNHIYLFHSSEKSKMSIALANGKHADGMDALNLLKRHLNTASYDDIMQLLEMYPDSVIEFSAYSKCLGNLPGRNAVIWEVRNY
jgi:hypothetical protein